MNHFLHISDYSAAEYESLFARAAAIKAEVKRGERQPRLARHTLLMLFEKPSTRTRASFTAAMTQAGGAASELALSSLQIERGETVADTARVLSAYADVLMLRVKRHAMIEEFAANSSCPVINGLSDLSHPCQVLADIMTCRERCGGALADKTIAWVGDCNNVLYSWGEAAQLFGCRLRVACPPAYQREVPGAEMCADIMSAVDGADVVMTDVWVSMGDEDEARRRQEFADYRVTAAVLAAAAKDAIFMHCLPAHRGEEVDADVLDGVQSVVWQQAENRLHAQKALLLHLLKIDN